MKGGRSGEVRRRRYGSSVRGCRRAAWLHAGLQGNALFGAANHMASSISCHLWGIEGKERDDKHY